VRRPTSQQNATSQVAAAARQLFDFGTSAISQLNRHHEPVRPTEIADELALVRIQIELALALLRNQSQSVVKAGPLQCLAPLL